MSWSLSICLRLCRYESFPVKVGRAKFLTHLPGDSKSRATDAKPDQAGWNSTAAKGARNFRQLTQEVGLSRPSRSMTLWMMRLSHVSSGLIVDAATVT